MAIGLLLAQGGNDVRLVAPTPEAASEDDSVSVLALSGLHALGDGEGGGWGDYKPAPLPPAEALPYVSKEFDLCIHDWECKIVSRVQSCENPNANPWSISSTGDYGIMQINRFTWEWWLNQRGFNFETEWMIPERNVAMAFAIWQDYGWWEWNCF